jgi:sulfonate transport system permease protein
LRPPSIRLPPSAAPQMLVGLRQGFGFLINNARDFLWIDIIIFCLAVYALLGIVTDAGVRALEHRVLRYRA